MKSVVRIALLLGASTLVSTAALAQGSPAAGTNVPPTADTQANDAIATGTPGTQPPVNNEAQQVAAVEAAEELGNPEVVVTAQNRSQAVQDVPIKIDVVTAEQLTAAGFSDANDLGKVAPVAQIQQDQGQVRVTVRGVGNTSGGTADNSVVVNIDGEYINSPAPLGVSVFDLDRVEVLRGPQGTFYGRNATGGAVNFVTRKPRDTFGANISASYGNYDAVRVDGGIDIPLMPGIGLRFAGFYEDRDGYVGHPAQGPVRQGPFAFPGYAAGRSDDNTAYGGRASFLANDQEGLSVYIAGEYAKREFTPQAFAYLDLHQPANRPGPTCGNPGFQAVAPLVTNQTLCIPSGTNFLGNFNRAYYPASYNGLGRQYWNTHAFRARVDYEFSQAATLSYIGGYRYFEREPRSINSLPVIYANTTNYNNVKTQSHELRLAGNVNGIIYQVGGFYFREDTRNFGGFYLGNVYATTATGPGQANFGFYVNYNQRNQITDSKSGFGQVEVPFTDTLTAVGGIRYTDNKNTGYWRDKVGSFFGPQPRFVGVDNFTPLRVLRSQQSKWTWLAGLNFKPDSDTLFYGKVSTGFKGGSFDQVGEFGPETNTAYEAGMKKNFGERSQHIFNLTGFYYDYTGLQVNVLLSSAEGGRVFNAGSATIWGVEAESTINLDDNARLNASFNYLNSNLNELNALFSVYCVPTSEGGRGDCRIPPSPTLPNGDDLTSVGDLDPNTPGVQAPSYAGNRPAFSPEFIITAGYDHTFSLGSAGNVIARVNTTFKSSYFTQFLNYRDQQQKAYTQTDASIDYEPTPDITVSAFVRNIENERPLTQSYFLSAATDDIYNFQFGTPRTYGVRASYKF